MEKFKVMCGYPVNNGAYYSIHTDTNEIYLTKSKEKFDKAMAEGYFVIEPSGNPRRPKKE